MEFSRRHMERCSGSASADPQYARFFCTEAVARAKAAAGLLASLSNHETKSTNIAAEAESAMVQIVGLADSISELETFFKDAATIRAPLFEAKVQVDGIRTRAIDDYRRIGRWIKATRSLAVT